MNDWMMFGAVVYGIVGIAVAYTRFHLATCAQDLVVTALGWPLILLTIILTNLMKEDSK